MARTRRLMVAAFRAHSRSSRSVALAALSALSALATLASPGSALAADLIVSTSTTLEAGTYTVDLLRVESGATLTLKSSTASGQASVIQAAEVVIEAGAVLSANGQGYGASAGPGQGTDGAYQIGAGGGGHGGLGGGG